MDIMKRIANAPFWIGVFGVLGTAAISIGQLLGVDISAQANEVVKMATVVVTAAFAVGGLLGVFVDPTTPGIADKKDE